MSNTEQTLSELLGKHVEPEVLNTSFRAPMELVQELDFIADKTGKYRNEVIVTLLKYSIANWRKENGLEKT